MARRDVAEVSKESADHTEAIVSEVRKFLGKKKDPRFRVGFRRGAYYLETHAHDFFKQNLGADKRKGAVDFLLNKVYKREEGLFRRFDIANDYVVGYLQALYALPSLWGKYDKFDPTLLFRGLYGLFKEIGVPVWADKEKVELNEKQEAANGAIVGRVHEELSGQPTGVLVGYLRGVYYLELHSRFFFEKADSSKREEAISVLSEAVAVESEVFSVANKRNEIKRSYISCMKLLLPLLEENIGFEPNLLFSDLSHVISGMIRADKKLSSE